MDESFPVVIAAIRGINKIEIMKTNDASNVTGRCPSVKQFMFPLINHL